MQPNLEQTFILKSPSVSLKLSMLNSNGAQGSAARLEPCSPGEESFAIARLTKVLTICARPMAASVEFTSLTGLPEGQRLSETLREADARATGSFVRDIF